MTFQREARISWYDAHGGLAVGQVGELAIIDFDGFIERLFGPEYRRAKSGKASGAA